MNGLYFYKLVSPYSEDLTKDCKLTVNEIDHNFVTLKDAEISGATYDKVTQSLTLTRNNGEEMTVDLSTTLSGITTNLEVEYDSIDGVITIAHNGEKIAMTGFITKDNLSVETLTEVISDGTLTGLGAKKSPLGLSSVEKTGAYKPAIKYIDTFNGEVLPTVSHRAKGDRYLTHERVSKYGYLYNFATVKKINSELTNGWRVPTKEDWDGVLNSIEPCDEYRTHGSAIANNMLGKYAGKILKTNDKWLLIDDCDKDYIETETKVELDSSDEFDLELGGIKGTVVTKVLNPIGTDNYGMSLVPSGYYDDSDIMGYFLKRGYYWTSTQCNATDVYVKRFDYDKTGVVQTVESPNGYFSLRLVKDYDGSNHHDVEFINGMNYRTILLPNSNAANGYSVWTCQNIAFTNETYAFQEPNLGNELESREAYYINDWNGTDWERKELEEGESIVLKTGIDGDVDIEYRVVNGKLYSDAATIQSKVLADIQPELDEIFARLGESFVDKSGNTVSIFDKIENATESAHLANGVLGSGFTDSDGNVISVSNILETEIADRKEAIASLNEALQVERETRETADNEFTSTIGEINRRHEEDYNTTITLLDEEIARATEAEATLQANIDAEATRGSQAETVLTENLAKEEARATEAEATLQANIDAENARATEAEATLQANIDAETTRAIEAETVLTENLNAEVARATETENLIINTIARLVNKSSTYDSVTGILTLVADNEENNIQIQFNGNYGTF